MRNSDASLTTVARAIVGETSEPLIDMVRLKLGVLTPRLQASARNERNAPSIATIKNKLTRVEKLANELCEAINDKDLRTAWHDINFDDPAAIFHVEDWAERARRAKDQLKPTKRSKVRDELLSQLPWGELRTQRHCALVVGLFWEAAHGKWPSKRNSAAQKACKALYFFVSGINVGSVANPENSRWGKVLCDAEKRSLSGCPITFIIRELCKPITTFIQETRLH